MSPSSSSEKNDVIIIGGASAGLSAGLYTSRLALRTLLIARDIGGQALTNSIENYPAFEHIGGFELMSKLERQARVFGTEFVYEEVTSIVENSNDHHRTGFTVKTSNNKKYSTRAIILAFGKTPRNLNVPGEQGLKGRGVSYCAICDGPLFKQKRLAVIGVGDPALDSALFLKGIASKVYLVQQSHMPVGSHDTIRLLQNEKNVSFIFSSVVKSINGTSKVDSITIANTKNMSKESQLVIDGVFVELGYTAKTDFLKDLVQLNSNNEIIVDKYCATSKQGIFAAGDVTDVPYKQAVISAGQGSIAALSAYNYRQRIKGKPTIKGDWRSTVAKG